MLHSVDSPSEQGIQNILFRNICKVNSLYVIHMCKPYELYITHVLICSCSTQPVVTSTAVISKNRPGRSKQVADPCKKRGLRSFALDYSGFFHLHILSGC